MPVSYSKRLTDFDASQYVNFVIDFAFQWAANMHVDVVVRHRIYINSVGKCSAVSPIPTTTAVPFPGISLYSYSSSCGKKFIVVVF